MYSVQLQYLQNVQYSLQSKTCTTLYLLNTWSFISLCLFYAFSLYKCIIIYYVYALQLLYELVCWSSNSLFGWWILEVAYFVWEEVFTYCMFVLVWLSQNGCLKSFVYNIIIWLHFLFGFKSNMAKWFCS